MGGFERGELGFNGGGRFDGDAEGDAAGWWDAVSLRGLVDIDHVVFARVVIWRITYARTVDPENGAWFLVADCAEKSEVGTAGELDIGGGEGGRKEGDARKEEDDNVAEGGNGRKCEGVLCG